MSELDEARSRIFDLEVEIAKTAVRVELADAQARAASAEATSERLSRRVAELESALGRRSAIAHSALRGLRRFADLGARDG